jgi:hypothetical protein
MSKIPKDPQEIFPRVVEDYKRVFGEDLVSMMVYGSAASEEYIAGTSDINFIVVLSEKGMDALDRAFPCIAQWRKHRVAIPLFLTEDYIQTSLDTFPLEYLNFQKNYQLVYGRDMLETLTFAPEFIRLQCEREIKGKLLLLREAYLETGGKTKALRKLVRESLGAFVAIFSGLLYLKGEALPSHKRDVVMRTCAIFDMDTAVFEKLLDVNEARTKPSKGDMTALFGAYLKEIQRLWKRVDKLA